MSEFDGIEIPNFENPAEAAAPFAKSVGMNGNPDFEVEEERLLPLLDDVADGEDMFGTYFVTTNAAFSLPETIAEVNRTRLLSFNKLNFEGPFVSHSLIRIGKIGSYSVRALCLTFAEAKLLPFFDDIPEDHLLHVPVLAVDDIVRTDAS